MKILSIIRRTESKAMNNKYNMKSNGKRNEKNIGNHIGNMKMYEGCKQKFRWPCKKHIGTHWGSFLVVLAICPAHLLQTILACNKNRRTTRKDSKKKED